MQIFRHLTINDVQLEEFPFKRELSMEAYLIENEGVLSLDADTFNNVDIVEAELTLKQGRKSKDTDGRIDILATYSQEYIAVIELKLGQLEEIHLKQLEDYLAEKNQILEQYPDILSQEVSPIPKWIGVLVGNSIDPNLATKIRDGYFSPDGTQIFALTIQRFRGSDGHVFVTTDTYFNNINTVRDTSKYLFEGKSLGKGRLVLAVLKRHCEKKPNITFSELEQAFPRICQGSRGVFSTFEEANEILTSSGRKRHFLNTDELIQIEGSTIAVSSQWGIGNIEKFIKCARSLGHIIK
jgi:hypothetical protein